MRKNILQYQVASATSMSSNFTSSPTVIKYLDNCSYQINITTTNSIGTFTVQGSNDYSVSDTSNTVTNSGNWIDIPLQNGVPYANAANDQILIDLSLLPFNAIRMKYNSSTAGTGVCDIWLMAKQIA